MGRIAMSDKRFCRMQGRIFKTASEQGYDMEIFSREFLRSSFCAEKLDTEFSKYQASDVRTSWQEFFPGIEGRLVRSEIPLPHDIARWSGFMYRWIQIETGIPSAEIYEKLTFQDLFDMYPIYHSVGKPMASDRLEEEYGLEKVEKTYGSGG